MNKKRILSMLLCVMMVVTLFTGMIPAASAAGADTDNNGVVTKKEYDPDKGILTIEAYATGETVTTVTEEAVPCDIVLVLDVSGSMDDAITIGNVSNLSQLDKTKGATEGYYQVKYKGDWTEVRYRNGEWQYYGYFIWGEWKSIEGSGFINNSSNIGISKIYAMKDAVDSFIDTVAEQADTNNVDHKISIVKFADNSYYNKSESSIAEGNHRYDDGTNYTEVVKKLTDVNAAGASALKNAVNSLSADGATAADYGMTKAQYVLKSTDVRNDSNKIVVMFTDGEPTYSNSFSETVANNTVSAAKTLKQSGVKVYTIGTFSSESNNVKNYMNAVSSNYPNAESYTDRGTGKDLGYYKKASSSMEMSEIFTSIAIESTSGGSNTTLDSKAYVKDVVTKEFDLTYGADRSAINVYTAPCTGENSFGTKTVFKNAQVAIEDKTITVTNFDFSANWCGKDGSSYHGQKLIIEIPIVPNAEINEGKTYPTNGPESGVYDGNGNPVEKLPVPKINVAEKTYVIDYAQPLTVNSKEDWGQARITSIHDKVGSSDGPDMHYGTVSNDSSSITYIPNTMKWNGSDTLYSYQKNGGTEYTWAKVNFVPANNVYYEDTFVSTNGGIEYDGTWTTDVSSASSNVGTANTAETAGGWQNASLKDDTAYSNGSAHMAVASNDNLATASFTFTGTGVDVYSRTNGTTGTIFATIKGGSVNKAVSIDNLLQGGKDFYQVPTLSFSDLDYDTYTVTIYVTTAAEGRATYYLDGIRVYNPAGGNEDSNYPVTERNAQFTEIRDMLLKAEDFLADDSSKVGTVFVDRVGTNAGIADYKAYGPENEVYLASGQAIVFEVAGADNYYVGLSAPESSAAALVTNDSNASNITINHASDLYYKITPSSEGYIMIQNNGDGILAVSKLYTASASIPAPAPVRLRSMSYAPTMSYVNSFSTLSVVPYDDQTVDPDDSTDPTDPQPTSSIIKAIVDSLFRSIKNLFKWF